MLAGYMAVDSNGILGLPMSVAATVVVAFILFGVLLADHRRLAASSPTRRCSAWAGSAAGR